MHSPQSTEVRASRREPRFSPPRVGDIAQHQVLDERVVAIHVRVLIVMFVRRVLCDPNLAEGPHHVDCHVRYTLAVRWVEILVGKNRD
eukprot:3315329-Prymnesium_polylepis.2